MRDCPLRWCTTGSKRRTRRLAGPARSDRTCVRPSILITTYSEILCGVLALCTGYPSVALRYSTYQMNPRSAKNAELNILRGKGTYLKHSTARKHEGILSL